MTETSKHEAVERLKRALIEVGLPQSKAAKRLDITPSYLNRILSGTLVPGSDLAADIAILADKLDSSGLKAV